MPYERLTLEKVRDYIVSIEEMNNVFSDFSDLEIKEIGDGNLNYVYSITNKKNEKETVILKQAVPFLRCVGETFPLSKERMHIEIKALESEQRICPDLVPKIYYSSKEMCLIIMQNLSKHKVVRGEIIEGKYFPKISENLTDFLSRNLFYTSDYYLDNKTKKEMVRNFINIELCKITEDFVLTDPFEDNETNVYHEKLNLDEIKKFQRDPILKISAAEMKYAFMTKAEALLHGDFHLGSFMANENETYVIDPEFAFYGPIGFDIGKVMANFFMAYISQEYHQKRLGNNNSIEYRKWLFDTACYMYEGTIKKFDKLWIEHIKDTKPLYWDYPNGMNDFENLREETYKRIFEDVVGFAGCVLIRRTLGLAKNKDIADIKDLDERARLDMICLNIGREFLTKRKEIKRIDNLCHIVQKYSPLNKL